MRQTYRDAAITADSAIPFSRRAVIDNFTRTIICRGKIHSFARPRSPSARNQNGNVACASGVRACARRSIDRAREEIDWKRRTTSLFISRIEVFSSDRISPLSSSFNSQVPPAVPLRKKIHFLPLSPLLLIPSLLGGGEKEKATFKRDYPKATLSIYTSQYPARRYLSPSSPRHLRP